ncbi:hypothetical protein [Streptomyces justiciae]|uniref:DUF4381 domain-containing protein n=1 Tax=Streptomyces justiciae TaxID=2780140 RepID=A0ABU3LWB9_9ACTN|nr:hypothetical protein [Streptomyces justiciae]MDT7843540.1 hypothetical protein [Streptomyces justiciae]
MMPGLSSFSSAEAGEAASGGFSSTWTWSVVVALAALLVGAWFKINHRRRDQITKWYQPGYDAAGQARLLRDRLSLTTAVEGVTPELRELVDVISKLKLAEQRSPEVPFGVIVAELHGYSESLLPPDHAAKLAVDPSLLDTYLGLARMQGIRLESARTAIIAVQRMIEKRTRK